MKTSDNVVVQAGMTIWVLNSVVGGPISEHVVGGLEGRKILYDKSDEQGYLGCRAASAFAVKENAERARFANYPL